MKIEFTGRHIDVTTALRLHVEEQFERIDHLFDGKPAKAHVVIEVDRGKHKSDIVINWRNEVLTATTSGDDMYQSLSQTIGKIETQAKRLKDKVIDKSHRAQKSVIASMPPEREETSSRSPRIIVADEMAAKPMTAEEAVMELEEQDNKFLMFRNAKGGKVAVVFRREDGNFGLIQS